jgi:multidrug efflux pump subunit AcrB
VVARLITPMMAAHFLKDRGHEEPPSDFTEIYRGALTFAIGNPWKTFWMGIGVFVFSLVVLAPFVKMTFIPRFDNGIIQENVEIPPGTPLIEADRAVREIAARAMTLPEV